MTLHMTAESLGTQVVPDFWGFEYLQTPRCALLCHEEYFTALGHSPPGQTEGPGHEQQSYKGCPEAMLSFHCLVYPKDKVICSI